MVSKKSIDISTIKNTDDDFNKYLKYNDVSFNDIEEIRE
jgi:hypothetical protein